MNCSRIFCVAFPFVITLLALLLFLTVSFGPLKIGSLFLFEVDLTHLSINPNSLASLINSIPKPPRDLTGNNLTAADLALKNIYRVHLWGFCSGPTASNLTCNGPTFDWASSTVNTSFIQNVGAATGFSIVLPKAVSDGLTAFAASIKWAQVLDIAAVCLLGLEFFFSFFTGFSRLWSCLTYITAGIATSAVAGTAILCTVIVALVVGSLQASARPYGVGSSINTTFLALVWGSVALCIVGGLFWCLTICCCPPDHYSRRRRFVDDKDYYRRSSAYQPLAGQSQPAFANPAQQSYQTGVGYEPYSHRA
jgi:hypothetical protein